MDALTSFIVVIIAITIQFSLYAIKRLQEPLEPDHMKQKNSKKINQSNNPKCLLLIYKNQKISRNDRCEATGKKFKNCCGAL